MRGTRFTVRVPAYWDWRGHSCPHPRPRVTAWNPEPRPTGAAKAEPGAVVPSCKDLLGRLRQAWVWPEDHVGGGSVGTHRHCHQSPEHTCQVLTGCDTSYILIFCPSPDLEGGRQRKECGVTGTEEWLCGSACMWGSGAWQEEREGDQPFGGGVHVTVGSKDDLIMTPMNHDVGTVITSFYQ